MPIHKYNQLKLQYNRAVTIDNDPFPLLEFILCIFLIIVSTFATMAINYSYNIEHYTDALCYMFVTLVTAIPGMYCIISYRIVYII